MLHALSTAAGRVTQADGARSSIRVRAQVRAALLAVCLALAVWPAFALSGFRGQTYVRNADGSIGAALPNVAIGFVKEDGSARVDVRSDASGRYTVELAPGRWTAIATHEHHEDYHSAPGFFVVSANRFGTGNFFLRTPRMTIVLVLRHAEKADNSDDPPLSAAGQTRAALLAKLLDRAGITSVHSTRFVRTRATVQPTADRYRMPVDSYNQAAEIAATVLAEHRGDVVLVAAHSNTAVDVINALGAGLQPAVFDDYDNLFLVTIGDAGVNVTNLQYGADSDAAPDIARNQVQAKTLLLVGLNGSGADGQRLAHAARKAGVSAIYTSKQRVPLLMPLEKATGLKPKSYADAAMLAKQLYLSPRNGTFVIAGTHDQLRAVIRKVGGEPLPVLYAGDRDHLVALTLMPSRVSRLVHLRF